MNRKQVLLFAIILFLVGCNTQNETYVRNGKTVHGEFRKTYYSLLDSCNKYYDINSECGQELYMYYSEKSKAVYRQIYPQGNPCCDDEPKKVFDTICYPIKP